MRAKNRPTHSVFFTPLETGYMATALRLGIIGVLLIMVLTPLARATPAPDLVVVTEEFPPFSYIDRPTGKVTGVLTVMVETVLKKAGVRYTIRVLPWQRAYQMALTQPNVMIYSMARRPDREDLFEWGGRLTTVSFSFYRLRSREDVNPTSMEDAKRYRVGVTLGDFTHRYLEQQGFVPETAGGGLVPVREVELNIRKLLAGNIDLAPFTSLGLTSGCKAIALDCAQLEPTLPIPGLQSDHYFAFSRTTDPALIDSVRLAYRDLSAAGTLTPVVTE